MIKDFFKQKDIIVKRTIKSYSVIAMSGLACFAIATLQLAPIEALATNQNFCSQTARLLIKACRADIIDDLYTGYAICHNLSETSDRRNCKQEVQQAWGEGNQQCKQVKQARFSLCNQVGEQRYDPPFGEDFANNFINPLEIGSSVTPNPFFPLVSGNEWVYESIQTNDEGETFTETIRVNVTDKSKLIQGIPCIVVRDIVEEDGAVIEDTDDWYAQDVQGNVWYCGEIALNFESFEGDQPEDPEVTDIDGSWKSGRDGSKAGILFPLAPTIGEVIRQEVSWREAEDVIEILSLSGNETTPGASCSNDCLVTKDFTPLDPGVEETKYYAPGVGLILELDADGNRVELISYSTP